MLYESNKSSLIQLTFIHNIRNAMFIFLLALDTEVDNNNKIHIKLPYQRFFTFGIPSVEALQLDVAHLNIPVFTKVVYKQTSFVSVISVERNFTRLT